MAEAFNKIRVVLINTTHPGNIGATARAMKVMGLDQLHLVTPKTFPSAEATALASGADDLLARAEVHETLDDALKGATLVLGTSARLRSLAMPQLDARAAGRLSVKELAEGPDATIAILFGRERYGLTNEEMDRCHYLVHIPANPEYSSLNLAQSVQVLAYEMRMAILGDSPGDARVLDPPDYEPAGAEQVEGLMSHLQQTLLDIGFLNPDQPKKLMARLRRLFQRARPDQNEVNILRGVLAAAQQPRNKRPSKTGNDGTDDSGSPDGNARES